MCVYVSVCVYIGTYTHNTNLQKYDMRTENIAAAEATSSCRGKHCFLLPHLSFAGTFLFCLLCPFSILSYCGSMRQ
jgi:hypothetical protein